MVLMLSNHDPITKDGRCSVRSLNLVNAYVCSSLFCFAQSTYISPSTALVPTVTVGRMRDLFFGLGSREPKA
jgi:hypothetical protein